MKRSLIELKIIHVYQSINQNSEINFEYLAREKEHKNIFFKKLVKDSEKIDDGLMYKNIGEITTEDFNMIDIVIQFYLEQLGRNKNTINVSEKLKLYYSKNKELKKESDMILKNFINDVVKSTIFLRNEFKKINNTLFLKYLI